MRTSATLRTINRLKSKCRAIHVARRQLDLDDASYRKLLQLAAGVKSSADIHSIDKADAVLNAMTRLGFQHKPKIKPGLRPGTPSTLDKEPYLQKIEAMLADMELPWAYAEKIAENITGGKKPEAIKRLVWVRQQKHLVGIIAALHTEKAKRVAKAREELGRQLATHGLTPQWAADQAEDMGRLNQPWIWHECLETLRLINTRLEKLA